MSADNYICLLKCTDGYRVAHCQALENLYYWPTGKISNEKSFNPDTGKFEDMEEYEERTEINPEILKDFFKHSPILTEEEAEKVAIQLEKEIGYVEYGIVDIKYDKEFPK